jgi:hypothetical protein
VIKNFKFIIRCFYLFKGTHCFVEILLLAIELKYSTRFFFAAEKFVIVSRLVANFGMRTVSGRMAEIRFVCASPGFLLTLDVCCCPEP